MSDSRPQECSHCKNACNVHLTQIVGGKMMKVDMCDSCPKAKGLDDGYGYDLAGTMDATPKTKPLASPNGQACPACGLKQSDFKDTGRMGCPSCYDFYAKKIEPILDNLHEGPTHVGKTPRRMRSKLDLAMIAQLRDKLQQHVSREEYEEAAALRDRIAKLEQLK